MNNNIVTIRIYRKENSFKSTSDKNWEQLPKYIEIDLTDLENAASSIKKQVKNNQLGAYMSSELNIVNIRLYNNTLVTINTYRGLISIRINKDSLQNLHLLNKANEIVRIDNLVLLARMLNNRNTLGDYIIDTFDNIKITLEERKNTIRTNIEKKEYVWQIK